MTAQPQPPNSFCNFNREALAMLADAQRRLLARRKRRRVPRDPRGENNLKRIERLLTDRDV